MKVKINNKSFSASEAILVFADKRVSQTAKNIFSDKALKLAKSLGFNPLSKTDWYGWAGADENAVIKKLSDSDLQIVLSPDQYAIDFQYVDNDEMYVYYIAKYEDAKPETIIRILKNLDEVIKLVKEGDVNKLKSTYKLYLQ